MINKILINNIEIEIMKLYQMKTQDSLIEGAYDKESLDMEEWTPEIVIHRGTHILNPVLDFWDIPHPRQDFYQSFLGH